MKRSLALLRVSTDGQDVARQRADIAKLKKLHSLDVVRTLELVGVSGTTTLSNEEVQKVLREVQQPGIDGLAASSVDRLFRPKRGSHFGILDGLQEARKTLWTVRDGALELWTDEGWERAMSAGVRAGSELREIARRCRDGKAEKRAEGRNVNGSVVLPDGLLFDKRTGWSYDPAELAKITKAYQLLFEDRYSLSEIERLVGWPRRRIRTLANPTWKGLRVYPPNGDQTETLEIPLPLEPVLRPDQWARAQTLLLKRRTWSRETRDQRFLGGGLLLCECGQKYYFHCDTRRGQHDLYYCSSRFPKGPGCGAASLRRLTVDAAIMHIVEERLTDPKFLASVFRKRKETPAPDTRIEREKELATLEARRQKWIKQFDAERISEKEFEERMDKVNAALRQMESTMPAAPPPPQVDDRVIAGLVRTLGRFRTLPFLEQRATLKRVVPAFQVVDGKIGEITLSGSFLGELIHTNSGQPLRWRCWRRFRGRGSR